MALEIGVKEAILKKLSKQNKNMNKMKRGETPLRRISVFLMIDALFTYIPKSHSMFYVYVGP